MADATSWLGLRIDDAYGARIGDVQDVYLEADGSPRWIFTRPARVLIPARDAMAGAGRVWVPYERELVRGAPPVVSLDHVTPELEDTTRRWYAAGHPQVPCDRPGWVSQRRDHLPPLTVAQDPLPPLRAVPPRLPPPARDAIPPQAGAPAQAPSAADGRQVVMVFNIGCEQQGTQDPSRRPRDNWDEDAARALAEYARRTGTSA